MKKAHNVVTLLTLLTGTLLLNPAPPLLANEPDPRLTKMAQLFDQGERGEEDLYRDEQLLLSATGSLKPVHLAPSVASVISKEDIEAMGARTLNEALETVPGLHMAPSDTFGPMMENINIRGVSTPLNPQVLVMVDGVPITSQWNGNRNYRFDMPVTMISRIEVVRGPGSAVHGADAFAGTINVTTKDGQEINGIAMGGRYGSFDSGDIWLQYGGLSAGWDVVASIDFQKLGTDSNRIIDQDLQTTFDSTFGTDASLAPGTMNLDRDAVEFHLGARKGGWTARVWGQIIQNSALGVGAAPVLDSDGYQDNKQYIGDLSYHQEEILPDLALDLRLNYVDLDQNVSYTLFPGGSVLPIGNDGNLNFTGTPTLFTAGYISQLGGTEDTLSTEAVGLYDGLDQHQIRLALGYKDIKYDLWEKKNFGPSVLDGSEGVVDGTLTDVTSTPYIFGPDGGRKLWYISLQDEWLLARYWELTAGIRFDDYSDFGSTTNPRLALVWQTRYDLTTKLLYGQAFRAPSFSELYSQNNPVLLGNSTLNPETMETLELAMDYRPTMALQLRANIYGYTIKDLIEAVPDGNGASNTNQNSRNQEGYGLELEGQWQAAKALLLKANGAWQQSDDSNTEEDVPNTPGLQFYANAHYIFLNEWSLDGQWFWIGNSKRATGDSREDIADYSIVNLTLRRKNIINNVDIALALRNAFDQDVRAPSINIANDYPMDSRAIWLELRGHY